MVHSKNIKNGSAIALSLIYLTLMIILVLGVTLLLGKVFRSIDLINSTKQAALHSETAMELALYDLKLRREGFENNVDNVTVDIDNGSTYSYSINYQNQDVPTDTELSSLSTNIGIGSKKLALFYDSIDSGGQDKIVDLFDQSNPDLLISARQTNGSFETECVEIKLSGKLKSNPQKYETMSSNLPCDTLTNLFSVLSLTDSSTRFSVDKQLHSGSTSISQFLQDHTENYILLRNIAKKSPVTVQIKTGVGPDAPKIASYYKEIEVIGRVRNVEIKKKARFEQDQLPEILTTSLLHN